MDAFFLDRELSGLDATLAKAVKERDDLHKWNNKLQEMVSRLWNTMRAQSYII